MGKVYHQNDRGIYRLPLYYRFMFWLTFMVFLALVATGVDWVVGSSLSQLVAFLAWFAVALALAVKVALFVAQMVKKGPIKALQEQVMTGNVTRSLLATMALNRMRDTPFIEVPAVAVDLGAPLSATVQVERLAGMPAIDQLTQDISTAFAGAYRSFAVTSSIATADGLHYRFILEDAGSDKTWRPQATSDFRQPSHVLKLQEGLTINLADTPHIGIWGRSGSGKSTLIMALVMQLFAQGADIRFLDGKNEFSAFGLFYPEEKLAMTTEAILRLLESVLELIVERQALVAQGVRERRKMGLRAYDLDLAPVVVVADEIGSVVAGMDSKQKKEFYAHLTAILQKGRSLSIFAIIGTQSPKAETTLPTDLRNQLATRILLGSASPETQRMAFDGDVATAGNVEPFTGFYVSEGKTVQPMKFFVPDLHSYGMNELDTFEKVYEMGKAS